VTATPTLSLCILTKDSASRLPELLAHGRTLADEIVVGVDRASSDATFDVAARHADVVFRFEATGLVGPGSPRRSSGIATILQRSVRSDRLA